MSDEVTALLSVPMRSYKEWEVFDAKVASLVDRGLLRRTDPLRRIYSRYEEWYLDPVRGRLYVYLKPGDKTLPLWEEADPFATPVRHSGSNMVEKGLQLISNEGLRRETLSGNKWLLDFLTDKGEIEPIDVPKLGDTQPGYSETWYREVSSGDVYRLIENPAEDEYRWMRISMDEVRIRFGTAVLN